MIKSDHHESYIVAIWMWLKWPKGIKGQSHLILIPRGGLILPQSREPAEVRAQPYSSGAHRPCSARAITMRPYPSLLKILITLTTVILTILLFFSRYPTRLMALNIDLKRGAHSSVKSANNWNADSAVVFNPAQQKFLKDSITRIHSGESTFPSLWTH
jgi:hypothetical protein